MRHQSCERDERVFDTTRPAREAHPPPLYGSADALYRSLRRVRTPGFINLRGIEICELAVDSANFVGRAMFGHEPRNLVTLIEIIEIHNALRLRKREHGRSLGLVGLRK